MPTDQNRGSMQADHFVGSNRKTITNYEYGGFMMKTMTIKNAVEYGLNEKIAIHTPTQEAYNRLS